MRSKQFVATKKMGVTNFFIHCVLIFVVVKNLAIIPARGGSKRIPRKNIRPFLGKPIIAYAIETALKSGLFDEVIVSTDDEDIAAIAKENGASVPFYRSKESSNDFATTDDVIREVLLKLRFMNKEFDAICCMYPTAPLLSIESLDKAYHQMIDKNLDSVFAVTEFSYPIYRGLQIDKNGKVGMIWPEYKKSRSQDLPKTYHDSGQFYWIKTSQYLDKHSLWTDNTGVILLSNLEVQDIDTETDWQIAELKYQLKNNK
jgi:pseudaminic acid cytidylyltransferase